LKALANFVAEIGCSISTLIEA